MLIKGISNGKANKKNISSMVRLRKPYQYYFVNTLLENFYEVLKYMSEVVISRRGGSGGKPKVLVEELITENTIWTVPENIVEGIAYVWLAGAGGGSTHVSGDVDNKRQCDNTCGGGGGWMSNIGLVLQAGDKINITIGRHGNSIVGTAGNGGAGGPSSFGTYIFANGGGGGKYYWDMAGGDGGAGGGGSLRGGIGYQFGGGLGRESRGGNGGVWGGGGAPGGGGGKYGGGGGGHAFYYRGGHYFSGGSGGEYGGGGGASKDDEIGHGGTYGGNGGGNTISAENGTNTIGWTNVMKDENGNYITGDGKAGGLGCGGGGFGGNGGYAYVDRPDDIDREFACGGGGGYGSKGGTGGSRPDMWQPVIGGGGGGYIGNGSDGYLSKRFQWGGGGGYGKEAVGFGGGGGYYAPAVDFGGGGVRLGNKIFGSGASMLNSTYGNEAQNGGCLIQYYKLL